MTKSTAAKKPPTISARLANGEREQAMKENNEEIKRFGRQIQEEFDQLGSLKQGR